MSAQAEQTRPVAVVTGASAGLGAEYARQLAARGHDLVLVARRRERLEELARSLEPLGARSECVAADLGDPGQTAEAASRVAQRAPAVLVNNAGFGIGRAFARSDLAREEEMLRVHVGAAVRLTHAVLPGMVARGAGAVVNVASFAAFVPGPNNATYGATKAFLVSFSESLHVELRGTGVRVQALCPGFTHTEFHAAARVDEKTIPSLLWLSAESVVRESLDALGRGGPVVVPGLRYRLLRGLAAIAPRPLVRSMTARAMGVRPARRRR